METNDANINSEVHIDEDVDKLGEGKATKCILTETELCDLLPEKPQEPCQSDCCGTGCQPCVFDIYDEEIKIWKEECEKIRLGSYYSNDQSDQALNPTEYHQFEITSITQESADSFIYRFSIPGYRSLGLQVGQHIILRWKKSEQTLTRQYTPVSDVTAKGFFDVLIKVYDDGKMSQYVKSWKTADKIEWRGPFGNFAYKPNKYQQLVMLAAGTGIAPMVQIIRAILNNEDDETRVHLVYCCREYKQLLLKKLLDQWTDFWNFSVSYVLSQDSSEDGQERYGDKIHIGRLSEEMVKDILGHDVDSTLVLICGTRSFDKDMVNYVTRLGLTEQNFFKF